jgi:hypothetical protein
MRAGSRQALKTIYFEGEMLPEWAQLLDVAARVCAAEPAARDWFAAFTNGPGVADARTVLDHCDLLRRQVMEKRDILLDALAREPRDSQPDLVVAAWLYALDTMIQQASSSKTCHWRMESAEARGGDDFGEGEVSLRRV